MNSKHFDSYCTTSEAAAIIGVTESYVRRLARDNRLPSNKVGPRAILIPRAAAEKMRDNPPSGPGRKRSKSA